MDNQFRPQGFSILPTVVKNLLIINGIFFLADIAFSMAWNIDLAKYLGLHYIQASDFRPYQLITYMFMHGGPSHLFFNMFALWMFGYSIENAWGPKRFLIFYFVCGIGAGLMQELVQYIQFSNMNIIEIQGIKGVIIGNEAYSLDAFTTVGASGAVYGLLLAFGMMWPNSRIYIYFAIPIKAKWFVIIYGALELVSGLNSINNSFDNNVAHFAHLGGMLFGLLLILYWRYKENGGKPIFNIKFNRNRNNSNTGRPQSDWDYNKKQADIDKKTDEILDKISKGGYDSLTKEEKDFLFRQSKKY